MNTVLGANKTDWGGRLPRALNTTPLFVHVTRSIDVKRVTLWSVRNPQFPMPDLLHPLSPFGSVQSPYEAALVCGMKKCSTFWCVAAPFGALACTNAVAIGQIGKWMTVVNLDTVHPFHNTGPMAFYRNADQRKETAEECGKAHF